MWALSEVRRSLRRVLMPGELEVLTAPVRHVQEGAYRPGWLTVTEQRLVEHSVFHPFPLSIPWSQVLPVEVGQAAVPERADEHELLSREARLRLAAAPAHDEAHLRLTTPAMADHLRMLREAWTLSGAVVEADAAAAPAWSGPAHVADPRWFDDDLAAMVLALLGRQVPQPAALPPFPLTATPAVSQSRVDPSWALSLLCLAGDERDLAARQGLLLAANPTQLRRAWEALTPQSSDAHVAFQRVRESLRELGSAASQSQSAFPAGEVPLPPGLPPWVRRVYRCLACGSTAGLSTPGRIYRFGQCPGCLRRMEIS